LVGRSRLTQLPTAVYNKNRTLHLNRQGKSGQYESVK
jgi:hypothetical protein